jgi:hypothetical protein
MTLPLLFGFVTFICSMFIHGLMFLVILKLIQGYLQRGHVSLSHNYLTLIVTVMVILIAHICSIALWAWVFIILGEFSSFETAFYFSGVSYTTLGYGDIILSKAWRLLGPLEAVNGVIMIGWTTATIFAVQITLVRQRLKTKSFL